MSEQQAGRSEAKSKNKEDQDECKRREMVLDKNT
jgi:hypothetical protein